MTDHLPRVHQPCPTCPWRRDHAPGTFGIDRYAQLADTCPSVGGGQYGSPMFACHKTPEGQERACAGWLAVEGHGHIGVRLAVATGRLDPAALTPGDDWPPLWDDYPQMVAAVAGEPGACLIPAPQLPAQ